MKLLRLFLLLILTILTCHIFVAAQNQNELAEYIKENYTKREVSIPMRDGVKLFTSIYEPKDKSNKYPILMSRTPYSVAPYGADKFKTSLGSERTFCERRLHFCLSGCARSFDERRRICGRASRHCEHRSKLKLTNQPTLTTRLTGW